MTASHAGREDPAQVEASAQTVGASRPRDISQSVGAAQSSTGIAGTARSVEVLPAFDTHRPPPLALIEDCVHCGFCLSTCPTYLLWGEEMDSPRGRIYLMREALEGEPLTDSVVRHWDQCLGCLACVTACPSGVQYGALLEATRAQVERRFPRTLADRVFRALIYRLFPYPDRLRALMPLLRLYRSSRLDQMARRTGLLRRMPNRLRALEELSPPAPEREESIGEWTPAQGTERRRVALLLGCVQRAFFSDVNAATVRVLAAEGCTVFAPRSQGCCGALSLHTGREAEAKDFARALIDSLELAQVDTIVANVAGCGSAMKEYASLLDDDPVYAERARRFAGAVRDVSELLSELGPAAPRHPVPLSVVYHDACHLAHGQGVRAEPRALLAAIPGLQLREVPREREICCGSAGTYNLLEPDPARELGERKARAVLEAGAQVLVTANPGCHLQITAAARRLGHALPAAHVIQILDLSLRGAAPDALLGEA